MSQEDNPDYAQETLMANCISESEKKDGAQNGGNGGHEHRQGPEIGCGSMQIRVRHNP
jgi:hypothetical protein